MSDLISRQDVYHILEKKMIDRPLDSDRWVIRDIDKAIRMLPSADRPTGEWTDNHNGTFTCDQCGCKHSKSNYCPNCGCLMKKGD